MTEFTVAGASARMRADLDKILKSSGISPDGCPRLVTALTGWASGIAIETAKEQFDWATSIPGGFNTTKSFDTIYLWCTRCPGGINGLAPLSEMEIGDPDGLAIWFKIMREHDILHRQGLTVPGAALQGPVPPAAAVPGDADRADPLDPGDAIQAAIQVKREMVNDH